MRPARSKIGSMAEPSTARRRRRDRYGRIVAACRLGPTRPQRMDRCRGLGARLPALLLGLRQPRIVGKVGAARDLARTLRCAMGLACRGSPVRRLLGQSDGSATRSSSDRGQCLIKGNISRDGKRIYHVPGGQYYKRTRISPSKGERWFCSEAEARTRGVAKIQAVELTSRWRRVWPSLVSGHTWPRPRRSVTLAALNDDHRPERPHAERVAVLSGSAGSGHSSPVSAIARPVAAPQSTAAWLLESIRIPPPGRCRVQGCGRGLQNAPDRRRSRPGLPPSAVLGDSLQ